MSEWVWACISARTTEFSEGFQRVFPPELFRVQWMAAVHSPSPISDSRWEYIYIYSGAICNICKCRALYTYKCRCDHSVAPPPAITRLLQPPFFCLTLSFSRPGFHKEELDSRTRMRIGAGKCVTWSWLLARPSARPNASLSDDGRSSDIQKN